MRGEPVPPVPVQRSLLAQRPQRKNEIAEQVSHLRRGLGPTVGGLGTKPRSGAKSSAPVLGAEARNLCDLIDSAISVLIKMLHRPRHEIQPAALPATQPDAGRHRQKIPSAWPDHIPATLSRLKSPRRDENIPPKIRTRLASQATTGFLFVQWSGFAIVVLK
jgi:hypothetical protein